MKSKERLCRPCYICGNDKFTKVADEVRDAKDIMVYKCLNCGLVFLSSHKHISNQFYADSGMHAADSSIEKWLQETAQDDQRRFVLLAPELKGKSVLDFGCGNGGFLLRARTVAYKAHGVELEARLAGHFAHHGLKVSHTVGASSDDYDIITLFHVLEHLPDPVETMVQLSRHLKDNGQIIVEVPSANDALLSLYECDAFARFTYWSCHLYLYNPGNLEIIGEKAQLRLNYIRQIQRYPLANHLYWLSRGLPGGHKVWETLASPELDAAYAERLSANGLCDTILASFSKT